MIKLLMKSIDQKRNKDKLESAEKKTKLCINQHFSKKQKMSTVEKKHMYTQAIIGKRERKWITQIAQIFFELGLYY